MKPDEVGARVDIQVLIATKDRYDLLEGRALKSVETQTVRPAGLVVVNDGRPFSSEQTARIRHAVRGVPVRLEHNSRAPGAAGAWNSGLAAISSSSVDGYVAVLDDDDSWDPDHLASNLRIAIDHDADVVISGLRMLKDGEPIARELPDGLIDRDFLVGNPGWQGSNTFVRVSSIQKAGGYTEGLPSLNDRDMAIRLLRLPGLRIAYTGCWTATWHLDSSRPCLSSPGTVSKIRAYQWFWALYGHEMTRPEARLFFGRAERLFGVTREMIARPVDGHLACIDGTTRAINGGAS